jgi:hypothetical protein
MAAFPAAHDDEVAGKRRDRLLGGNGDAGGDEAEDRGQPRRVVDPDRHARDQNAYERSQARGLIGPEDDAIAGMRVCDCTDNPREGDAEQDDADADRQRQPQFRGHGDHAEHGACRGRLSCASR